MSITRAKTKDNIPTIDAVIHKFEHDVKTGPIYVCSCCHRLMYRKSVIQMKDTAKYKTDTDIINMVFAPQFRYVSVDNKEWICKTCDGTLKSGRMPFQAKSNGFQLVDIPKELKDLNPLETYLVCLMIPFMKMVALPRGKQKGIHGPAVNVPTDVQPVCKLLPRLPSEARVIGLKLKRKLQYRGHYMYKYIDPLPWSLICTRTLIHKKYYQHFCG